MDHKKNAERIQNIRQGKFSGMLSSNSEIISLIESRIGQLHVDALDRRKMNIPIVVQEEAGFVMLFAGRKLASCNFL